MAKRVKTLPPIFKREKHPQYSHGHATEGISPTYHSWASMKKRCLNQKCKFYNDYGGRGITVCNKWLKFEGFLEDMGEKPIGTSLDRIDNDLGYYKENCRWATKEQQANNKRSNRTFSFEGRTLTLGEWATETGISHKLLHQRIFRDGMDIEKAITKPRRRW